MTSPAATAISLALWSCLAGPARAQDFTPREVSVPQHIEFKGAVFGKDGPATQPIPNTTIVRTAAQTNRPKTGDEDLDFLKISTELPGLERLTRRESEAQFRERVRQESQRPGSPTRVGFPEEIPLSKEPFAPRQFEPMRTTVEAMYVDHCRLYFEQPNFERQAWNLGILTPVANLAVFYYDVLLFPYHFWTRPCDRCDSSAGKCLPGDSTPLYFYWEEFSWTGLAGQAVTVFGIAAMVP